MNKQDKELAVKIFDYFISSKLKILYWNIYSKFVIDGFDYCFSIDCCIQMPNDSIAAICYLKFGNSLSAASFTMENNYMSTKNMLISVHRQEALSSPFPNIPDNIKAIVIEECLERNEALYASSINNNLNINIMLIPAARSLEELMIKMELES